MKRQILKTLVITCLALECCSTNDLGRTAIITGYDVRLCACCGGLMINFDNNTQPYSGDFFLIDNSNELAIGSHPTFPIRAIVTYKLLPNTCGGKHIHVNSLTVVK